MFLNKLFILFYWLIVTWGFQPDIKITDFNGPPKELVFFEGTSVILFHDSNTGTVSRSNDGGGSWNPVKLGKKTNTPVAIIISHPYEKNRVYALSSDGIHYVSQDYGENWSSFNLPCKALVGPNPLDFHAQNPDMILITIETCPSKSRPGSPDCKEIVYYTTDNFKSKPKQLIAERGPCFFAKGKPEFNSHDNNEQGIICQTQSSKLAYSTDFFNSKDFVKIDNKEVNNIVSFGAVSKFFLAAIKLDSQANHVALIVTTDLNTWKQAEFPHEGGIEETAFTILESSAHSLHVDVKSDTRDFWQEEGTFYTSNSDGTVFRKSLEHTNRDLFGFVDIEQIEGVEGVLIANVVEGNRIRTKISYDDGRTWNYLSTNDENCPGDTSCSLNLFSVTDMIEMGRVFKSPAPGLIAAIGSQGSGLSNFNDNNLFVSDNSGLTWKKVAGSSGSYQWGNQGNILISVPERPFTDEIMYSVNSGDNWETVKLDKNYDIILITADPDSTAMKFVLVALSTEGTIRMIQLDFSKLYSRECKLSSDGTEDFEKWYARYDKSGKPNCVMGRMEYFYRKKKGAQCYIGNLKYDNEVMEESCACSEQDYECDVGFESIGRTDTGSVKCGPNAELSKQLLQSCAKPGDKYERPRGYRLIPGNSCSKDIKGSIILDDKVEEICGKESFSGSGNITTNQFILDNELSEYVYLKNHGDFPGDETVIVRTRSAKIYITHDQGTNWKSILDGTDVFAVFPNSFSPNVVYFLATDKLYYSTDRGRTIIGINSPASPNPFKAPQALTFHPVHPEWIIYTGEKGCDEPFSKSCTVSSYYSTDYGHSWKTLVQDTHRCSWITQSDKWNNENLIFCDQQYHDNGKVKRRLIASNDTFQTQVEHFSHVVGFAQEQNFVVVATADDKGSLQAMVTIDGEHFAEAKFPHNFVVDHQQAYTILESPTGAILMHVTVTDTPGLESGALLKSNYNGTDYVMSLENVNRNSQGYVDFERMQGLEGVAFANVVWSTEIAQARKHLKTVITHNDGAEWRYVPAPKTDVDGKPYCERDEGGPCTLNLHGYTERVDYRDSYSSPSAVGLSVAVGNVGAYLTAKKDANTYITRDGGITWKEVMKGPYLWEYGDSGSIIALVKEGEATNILQYSLDEGETWQQYQFSDIMVNVRDISTVQSDTSRKFIIWAKYPASEGSKFAAIQVDFSSFAQRKCILDSGNSQQDDFELWSPKHPLADDNCLFGHQSFYHRKIPGRDCFIGANIASPHQTVQNCTCTRRDFECDFNYSLAKDGTCQLVEGYSPPDHMQVCNEMPGTVEYWEPTGYRRIPMTTCHSGKQLDKTISHPCPGKEEEYRKSHGGLDGFGLFVAIILPIILSTVIGYIVWDHYSKRYGQIRLGEEDAYKDQPIAIRYGIIAIAAIAALVMALPTFCNKVFDVAKSFISHPSSFAYTTRDHFARSSERYYSVDDDEEDRDLLVEDDDEDAEEL